MKAYVYELRRGTEIVGTRRFSSDEQYAVGDTFNADGSRGVIVDVVPVSGETRLIVEFDRGLHALIA